VTHELWYQLGWILKIRVDDDDGVAGGVIQPCRQGDLFPVIAAEVDDRHPAVVAA
jgi:hypothetical protein